MNDIVFDYILQNTEENHKFVEKFYKRKDDLYSMLYDYILILNGKYELLMSHQLLYSTNIKILTIKDIQKDLRKKKIMKLIENN